MRQATVHSAPSGAGARAAAQRQAQRVAQQNRSLDEFGANFERVEQMQQYKAFG